MFKHTESKKNLGVVWTEMSTADGVLFWREIGPLATNKAVVKELGGYPIYVNENQTWLVARDKQGWVLAVGSIAPAVNKDGSMWLDYAYVAPEFRGMGLWTELLELRLEFAKAAGAKVARCCTAMMARPLEAAGFKVTSQRGSWSYMEKAL